VKPGKIIIGFGQRVIVTNGSLAMGWEDRWLADPASPANGREDACRRNLGNDAQEGSESMQMVHSNHSIEGAVMVVGGGITGIQAALDLADGGFLVYLIEKTPAIGGSMAQLDKTFPTNDCSM